MELKENQKVKRGEIYLHDFGSNEGSIQNGIRPVWTIVKKVDKGTEKIKSNSRNGQVIKGY